MARVVVVGSGAGGLASAARLATRRHEVTVLEAAAEFGGRLRPLHGVSVVPEIITIPAPLRDLFNKTGRSLDEVMELQPAPPTLVWLSDDRHVEIPSVDPAAVGDALGSVLGASTSAQFRQLMADAAELWQHVRRPLLETPGGSPTWLVNEVAASAGGRWKAMRLLRPHQSYSQAISVLESDDARSLLDLEALQAGSMPQGLPAWATTRVYARYVFGEWVVPGGNAALADVLINRARDRGANLRADSRVVAVQQVEGRVVSVTLNTGEIFPCDWVVSDVDDLSGLLGPNSESVQPDLSALVFVLEVPQSEVNSAVAGAERITVLPRDRRDALGALCDDDVLSDAWISIERTPHDSLDQARTHTIGWTIRVPVGVGQFHSAEVVGGLIAQLVSRGLLLRPDAVRIGAVLDSRDVAQHLNTPGGRLSGPAALGPWRTMLRPPITTDLAGLVRAGGGVLAGPGLPYAVQTGEVVADLIGRPSGGVAT